MKIRRLEIVPIGKIRTYDETVCEFIPFSIYSPLVEVKIFLEHTIQMAEILGAANEESANLMAVSATIGEITTAKP